MPNENCLAEMKCPNCGSEGPFYIRAESTFLVSDDGTDEYEDVEWFDGSRCRCKACEFSASVMRFKDPAPHQEEKNPGDEDNIEKGA